jgi:hypothetical protein
VIILPAGIVLVDLRTAPHPGHANFADIMKDKRSWGNDSTKVDNPRRANSFVRFRISATANLLPARNPGHGGNPERKVFLDKQERLILTARSRIASSFMTGRCQAISFHFISQTSLI